MRLPTGPRELVAPVVVEVAGNSEIGIL